MLSDLSNIFILVLYLIALGIMFKTWELKKAQRWELYVNGYKKLRDELTTLARMFTAAIGASFIYRLAHISDGFDHWWEPAFLVVYALCMVRGAWAFYQTFKFRHE